MIGIICTIKKIQKKMSIILRFEYIKGYSGKVKEFYMDPLVFLMNKCDCKVNRARIKQA